MLLNPARAGVVDEAALIEALRSGRVGGAALDDLNVIERADLDLYEQTGTAGS